MVSSPFVQTRQLNALVSRQSDVASMRASSLWALVVTGQPPSRFLDVTQQVALASVQKDKVMVQVSQYAVLVSYVEGATEKFNSRAWGFSLDQHQFYVLHLGEQGTFVYDILSTEWAQWKTEGYQTWNMENGVTWNDEIYAGDNSGPTLWRLDPDSYLDDDFRLITRVVTGGIPTEARNTLKTGMFVLSATKQGAIDEESTPYVQLSISDDGGFTYRNRNQIAIDPDTETQDFSWRSLGTIKTPGRVFKVTDVGGFVTIKGANQKIDGEDGDG